MKADRSAWSKQVHEACLVGNNLDDYLKERTGSEFFDVVFDCTGNGKAIEGGVAYVAHGTYWLVSSRT